MGEIQTVTIVTLFMTTILTFSSSIALYWIKKVSNNLEQINLKIVSLEDGKTANKESIIDLKDVINNHSLQLGILEKDVSNIKLVHKSHYPNESI